MKKYVVLFSSLLLVGLIIASNPQSAAADSEDEVVVLNAGGPATRSGAFYVENVQYTVIEGKTNEVMVTNHYFNKLAESVVIPATVTDAGIDYTVTKINDGALGLGASETDTVKNVVLPSTIESIGNSAFLNRGKLENITLSEGLQSIEANAFRGTTALKNIQLPTTLTNIGGYAFMNSGLVTVKIPDSVTSVGHGVFKEALSLKTAVLSAKQAAISNSMFSGARSLTNVTIPDAINLIESNAFNDTNLIEVTIPRGITNGEQLRGEAISTTSLEKITFTSALQEPEIYNNVFVQPKKKGYIFKGWLGSNNTKYSHENLRFAAALGDVTVTAQWEKDLMAPEDGLSDANIKLIEAQPVGSVSFGNVEVDAKMAFADVTLDGSEQKPAETTASKIVVNDTRSNKTNGWEVSVKYADTNFLDKGLKLGLAPTSTDTTGLTQGFLTEAEKGIINDGGAKKESYTVVLNPTLMIPTGFNETGQQTSNISWTLVPKV